MWSFVDLWAAVEVSPQPQQQLGRLAQACCSNQPPHKHPYWLCRRMGLSPYSFSTISIHKTQHIDAWSTCQNTAPARQTAAVSLGLVRDPSHSVQCNTNVILQHENWRSPKNIDCHHLLIPLSFKNGMMFFPLLWTWNWCFAAAILRKLAKAG